MKELLKRDFNKTYLILESEEKQYEESYEIEMLLQNQLELILPIQVQRVNAQMQIFYDITSKQSLKDCAEREKFSAEMLRKLFRAIDQVTKEAENYLLEIEHLRLDLEHIYRKEEQFYFCYCPWEPQELLQSFRTMLEEILGKLDYRDTEGVELAYHLYQSVCKGEFMITEILEEHSPKESPIPSEQSQVSYADPFQETVPETPLQKEIKDTGQQKKKYGFFRWLLQFFLKKETEELREEKKELPPLDQEISRRNSAEAKEPFGNTQVLDSAGSNTVLLDQMPAGRWRLRPLLPGYDEFCISEEQFLVGKKKGAVDGYIGRDSISRIHSRFYLRENRLFVADANSTNGTFVNSVALAPGKEVEIFQGDRILFADVGYECYNNL